MHSRAATITAGAAACGWLLLYGWRAIAGHLSLGTNAFDLSVFDYALWSLAHGGPGFVPFLGHSIFSEHFMPALYLLVPIYWVWPSPVALLVLQPAIAVTAAWLFLRVQRRFGVNAWMATALMLVFLLSRRTHSALAGYFYPEVLQAALTFAVVLTWDARAHLFWPCVLALLMTKEDAAIYVAALAAVMLVAGRGSTRRAWAALTVPIVWFALALTVAIPAHRLAEGLSATNPILQARYGAPEGGASAGLVRRVVSVKSARTLGNMLVTMGLLPAAGLMWLAPAAPGVLVNLAAAPDTLQSSLIDHYAWPILPWLFLSAAAGTVWMHKRWPKAAAAWIAVLLLATGADNPAVQRMFARRVPPDARLVRSQLANLTGHTILAQPNVIPHLPKAMSIFAIGSGVSPPVDPDLVLVTPVGNLWPFTPEEVQGLIARYRSDQRYDEIASGPLFAFRLKQ